MNCADADVIVLVGPNNSGKSRTLQEIQMRLGWLPGQAPLDRVCHALSDVEIDKRLSLDEIQTWFRENRLCFVSADGMERVRTIGSGEMFMHDLTTLWNAPTTPGPIAAHLVRTLFAGERLAYIGSPARLDVGAPPDHPIHALIGDSALRKDFADTFRAAFGLNIIVDAWGNTVRIHVSRDEKQADFEFSTQDGFPSKALVDRLNALPVLETQSDGVKSFAGIVLTLLAGKFPLVLLDEPEAFLHPPQARLLGRQLALRHTEAQLVVATHSLDILLGLLEAGRQKVLLVRLTREDDRTTSQVLPHETVTELWKDPLLRFSRTLDGLFHEAVIVGEGDTDTAFYNAVSSEAAPNSLTAGRHVMFTYPSGKHRIPLVTQALRAIGVPIRVIVDFDALNNVDILRKLVEGVGATWTEDLARSHRILDAHLRGSEAKLTTGSLKARLEEILGGDRDEEVTRVKIEALKEAMQPAAGWRLAKRIGRSAVPPGDAVQALDTLIVELRNRGIFVVESGAVESFVPAVGGKSSKWLGDVISGGYLVGAESARHFVAEVLASLGA